MNIELGLHVLCAGEICRELWLAEVLYTQGMAYSPSSVSLQLLKRGGVHSTLSGEAAVTGQRSRDRRSPQRVALQSQTPLEQTYRTLLMMLVAVVSVVGHFSVPELLPLPMSVQ